MEFPVQFCTPPFPLSPDLFSRSFIAGSTPSNFLLLNKFAFSLLTFSPLSRAEERVIESQILMKYRTCYLNDHVLYYQSSCTLPLNLDVVSIAMWWSYCVKTPTLSMSLDYSKPHVSAETNQFIWIQKLCCGRRWRMSMLVVVQYCKSSTICVSTTYLQYWTTNYP